MRGAAEGFRVGVKKGLGLGLGVGRGGRDVGRSGRSGLCREWDGR